MVRLTPLAYTSVAHWTRPARSSDSLNASAISEIAASHGPALTAAAKTTDTRCENGPTEMTAPPSCATGGRIGPLDRVPANYPVNLIRSDEVSKPPKCFPSHQAIGTPRSGKGAHHD